MKSAAGRLVRALLLGGVLVTGASGTAIAADPSPDSSPAPSGGPALPTLNAQPSVITAAVGPGQRVLTTLTLTAGVALDIRVTPEGLGQSAEDGSFTFLPRAEDASPYSARPLLTVTPSRFRLEAGETTELAVAVTMPSLPADGERFALLKVNGTPVPGSGNVGIAVALGVSVLVNIPGSLANVAGEFQDLRIGERLAAEPVTVNGLVRNTGNVHYGAASPKTLYHAAQLLDAGGNQVARTRQTLMGNSIVPTQARAFELILQSDRDLPSGRYSVVVETGLEDGTILDSERLEFDTNGIAGPAEPVPSIAPGGDLPAAAIAVAIALALLVAVAAALLWRRRRANRPA